MRELNEYPEWLNTPQGMYAADLASLLRRVLNKANITSGEIGCFRFGPEREDVVAATNHLRKRLANEQEVTANVTASLAVARANEQNLQQKLNGAVARAEELRTSRDYHFHARRDLQQMLLTAQSKIETLTAERDQKEAEWTAACKTIEELSEVLAKEQGLADRRGTRIGMFRADLRAAVEENEALRNKVEYQRERNIFLRNQLDIQNEHTQLLEDTTYTLRHDLNAIEGATESLRYLETKLRGSI